VIGIGGFYFGYDIGRMDHDEERIRAELKKTTADSEISIRPVAKGGTGKTEIEILTECLEDAKDTKWGKRFMGLLAKIAGERYGDFLEAVYTAPIRTIVTSFHVLTEQEAFAIVALLNEEHVLSSLAVLIKKVAQMKKKK
jgi:hypothetical protein